MSNRKVPLKRVFDIAVTVAVLPIGLFTLALVAVAVKLSSPGPVLHWSHRVGRDNRLFRMPKIRTMRIDTPQVASHLLADPKSWLTPIGGLLRSTSLDELPQLWSILVGDMSIVGPRPALYNQHDLVALRTAAGVHELTPGLTGWAQTNGRDELPIEVKVRLDVHYLENRSFLFDLKIILLTAWKVLRRQGTAVPDHVLAAGSVTAMVEALKRTASESQLKGDFDAAISDYNEALRLAPDDPEIYAGRGDAHIARKEYTPAVADFTQAIELAPTAAAYFYRRADARECLGQHNRASADRDAAARLNFQYAVGHSERDKISMRAPSENCRA